ncbi:hypothetical protein XELAEV_18019368mg [Xenopus laevis]|uniref:G-protein coupled receptors family 1 profile domain-containing protein n=1 Tax=Xenopus laevis TaxID=8355 RepID=A0A974HUS1_XENLA|nr:hypothetical protein XELAEV_18019368mg [Xenopus laevis]
MNIGNLVGFSDTLPLKVLLFSICLVIYIMTQSVNLMIIALYLGSHHLRSPMYFFLSNLSATDISLSTSVGPNLLCTLLKDRNPMSISACVTQFFAYGFFTGFECLLLTHCLHLVVWSWLEILILSLSSTIMISHSGLCGCKTLDNVYCDFAPLLESSCSDIFVMARMETILLTVATVLIFLSPLSFVITTYIIISLSIFRISSKIGRQKAFSTCSSHLNVVGTYYGILISKYTDPSKVQSVNVNILTSLLYTLVTPLFNPIIYSFRNQEIQNALKKLMSHSVP